MMQKVEKVNGADPRPLPPPIDPSYQPSKSFTKLPATASLEEVLTVLLRDGMVVLTDLIPLELLDNIDADIDPYMQINEGAESYDNFIQKGIQIICGLVGKSDNIINMLDTTEILHQLLKALLEEKYPVVVEDHTEECLIEPILNIGLALYSGQGTPRQALHRDDTTTCRYRPEKKPDHVDSFGFFIASSRVTRENGGTMMIPGSHLWEHNKQGTAEQVSFLEMERGDGAFFLGGVLHGGGQNTLPEVRKILSFFFMRGIYRQEENLYLCTPRSKVLKMSPRLLTLLGFKKPTGSDSSGYLGMVDATDASKRLPEIYEQMYTT